MNASIERMAAFLDKVASMKDPEKCVEGHSRCSDKPGGECSSVVLTLLELEQEKEIAKENTARTAVEAITKMVNSMSWEPEEFIAYMSREHRTLQASFMRLIVAWIEAQAKQKHYDLRNEAAINLSKKIVERCKDDLYIPFI